MQMIESFVVRRTVCGILTNQLRRIFTQMSGQMDTDDIVGFTRTCLSENRWPLDDEFRSKFVNFRLYIPSRLNRTRLVLTTLERSFGHKEVPDMTSDITIEHIMPQTLSSEWKEGLGEGATDIHERWLDTVGNLTLSGYNPNLGNKPFAEKRTLFAKTKFSLSESLQAVDEWNEAAMQRRGSELADRAVRVWGR